MQRLAGMAFPGYQAHSAKLLPNVNHAGRTDLQHHQQQQKGGEVISSLPLQVLLFFNLSFTMLWCIGMVGCALYKASVSMSSSWTYAWAVVAGVPVTALVDVYRVWVVGYAGNLMERIPELSGMVILSVVPCGAVSLYFVAVQRMFTATLAVEYCLCGVHLLMVFGELVFAWRVAKDIISAQAQSFFLTMQQHLDDDDDDQEEKDGNVSKKMVTHDGESLLYPDRSIRSLNIRSSRVLDVQ